MRTVKEDLFSVFILVFLQFQESFGFNIAFSGYRSFRIKALLSRTLRGLDSTLSPTCQSKKL